MLTAYRWELAVILVYLVIIPAGVAVNIDGTTVEWFGYPDPQPASDSTTPSTFSGDATGLIALLNKYPVQTDGVLFAFSARLQSAAAFTFQVYRPISPYEVLLLQNVPVMPSVVGQQEDFYIESFMSLVRCLYVRRGDLLGLYFTTAAPPVALRLATEVMSSKIDKQEPDITKSPQVGDVVRLSQIRFPWTFVASGFVDVNFTSEVDAGNESSSLLPAYVNCSKGMTMRPMASNSSETTSTTTYLPPTGVPGAIGLPGAKGSTGLTGPSGVIGVQGAMGTKGDVGSHGLDGAIGFTGPTYGGENGSVGQNGTDGATGFTGYTGFSGQDGAMGPVGPVGFDLRLPLPSATPRTGELVSDVFWVKDVCVEGMYIWLAIISFVSLLGFALLLVDCCMASRCCEDH